MVAIMNTEQKAKAYDESLERAKKLQETCESTVVVGWCEYIFPELKESEDEKIKRELRNDLILYVPTPERYIAWLEKQKNTQDKEYVFRPFAGEAIEKAAERAVELDGKVVLAFNGAYIPIGNKTKDEIVAEYNSWLEKHSHILDSDKVIEWLNDQACQGWIEDVEVDIFVDKFKEDFGL